MTGVERIATVSKAMKNKGFVSVEGDIFEMGGDDIKTKPFTEIHFVCILFLLRYSRFGIW